MGSDIDPRYQLSKKNQLSHHAKDGGQHHLGSAATLAKSPTQPHCYYHCR
jgi:hypothetical protein